MISFTILGQPQGKARHRTRVVKTKGGKVFAHEYPAEKTVLAEQSFLAQALPYRPAEPLTGPLRVFVVASFLRPKSHYRTGKNSHLLKDGVPKFHTSKPDATNILKTVEDALNGVFYQDDSQIADSRLVKVYGTEGGLQVNIWTME